MTVEIWEIQIDRIRPNCCMICDEDTIVRMCDDIRSRGLQEPIVVELVEYWFRIIDGEKRWRACKRIGMSTIKTVVLEVSP